MSGFAGKNGGKAMKIQLDQRLTNQSKDKLENKAKKP